MKCPACASDLKKVIQSGIELDICIDNCGGIWFDKDEISKFDEMHEKIDLGVLFSGKNQNYVVIDRNKERHCLHCNTILSINHFHSNNYQLEIDECPSCNSFWLDAGELNLLRELRNKKDTFDSVFKEFDQKNRDTPNSRAYAILKLLFK